MGLEGRFRKFSTMNYLVYQKKPPLGTDGREEHERAILWLHQKPILAVTKEV